MFSIGLIQGRLTPSRGRGIQFFPKETGEWELEFKLARRVGLSHIQWICPTDNPLFDPAFRARVKEVVTETGMPIRDMDLMFMTAQDIAAVSEEMMVRICESLSDVAGGAVEVPLMEASTLLDGEKYNARVDALRRLVSIGKNYGVSVAVENDLPPAGVLQLLADAPGITVVYDAGNNAGMGYDVVQDIAAYGRHISNVHIKDKPVGGTTVPLGMGAADFDMLFKELAAINYQGLITLQVARGEDGKEEETVGKQVAFVKAVYEKYF